MSTSTSYRTDQQSLSPARAWLGLSMMCLPVLLVAMDFSVLYLAMPTISDHLQPSAAQQLWILDIYGFLIAGLLITMGNVGDRFGRRRVLLSGATLFGIASIIAAFAPSATVLIGARALMGIGGATLLPASLSLVSNMFPNTRQRSLAIGVWTSVFAGGSAVGPVIGGVLLHHYWWGSVFLINVPILLVLLIFAPKIVPEYRSQSSEPFDIPGVILSLVGILPGVYAIKHIAADGIDTVGVVTAAVGIVGIVAFIHRQLHARHPLLQLNLFKAPGFSVAIASALFGMMTLGAMAYLSGTYLQSVRGMDVLSAALAGLPMALAVAAFSLGAAKVVNIFGMRAAFAGALTAAAVGNMLLLLVGTGSPLWVYLVATSIAGIGDGIVFSLVSEVAITAAPPERAGAASAISETSFELGTALGLALMGSLATLVYHHNSGGFLFADTLGETLENAAAEPGLAEAARSAYVSGMHAAALAGSVSLIIVAVIVVIVLRPRKPSAIEHG